MINILPMGRVFGVCTAGFVFVTATCGGVAVLDGSGDERGSGGSSASSSSRASSTTQGPVASAVSSGSGSGIDCALVCDDLWNCTQEDNLCPGLEPGDEATFKQGCLDNCNGPTGPALAGLVDPADCPGTVMTLIGVSMDFAAACQGTGGG